MTPSPDVSLLNLLFDDPENRPGDHFYLEVKVRDDRATEGYRWARMRPSAVDAPYKFTEDEVQAHFRTYNNERPGSYRIRRIEE